jgi:hypothetical protein
MVTLEDCKDRAAATFDLLVFSSPSAASLREITDRSLPTQVREIYRESVRLTLTLAGSTRPYSESDSELFQGVEGYLSDAANVEVRFRHLRSSVIVLFELCFWFERAIACKAAQPARCLVADMASSLESLRRWDIYDEPISSISLTTVNPSIRV